MWREIRSHWTKYKNETHRADVLKDMAAGEVHHRQLEVFRRTHGDRKADLACVGLTNVIHMDQLTCISVHDFLQAPRPKAKDVAREDIAVICLTYLHDPKAISGRLLDRMNRITWVMMLYGIGLTLRRQERFRVRIWNDITNSAGKDAQERLSWVGGGIIPYLLFEHVSVGYEPFGGFEDRLWPRIECKLASYARGTRFVLRDGNSIHPDADGNGIVVKDEVLRSYNRQNHVQEALKDVANWALSGPIFALPTYWESDRQALACMFGRILKSKLFTDMINAASEAPSINHADLMITRADEYKAVLENCCFDISQQMVESWHPNNETLKRFRKKAIIDGPRYTFTGPNQLWRADSAFIPSCFEYAPLSANTLVTNERRARRHTKAYIYRSSRGRTYALVKNSSSFFRQRAAVWVELQDVSSNFTRARVSKHTRIVADTDRHELAIAFGLAVDRIFYVAALRGMDLRWGLFGDV